ncbi:MAG: hypothetical protein ACYCXF_06800 [Thermoleophilia bacterium]
MATVADHSFWPSVHGDDVLAHTHAHSRPLSQRVLLEALLLTAVSIIVFWMLLGTQNNSFALSAASQVSSYGIDASRDPVQQETSPFQNTMEVSGGVANLSSDRSYSISARVESVKAYDDNISGTIPYDLLLAWGNMADSTVYDKLTWSQGNRQGSVSGALGGMNGADVSSDYVVNHVSNNHLIPASNEIRNALKTIKPGDLVRIDGRLVDVRVQMNDNRILTVQTSKTRSDQGDGACEIIFVDHLKINETTYR